MTRNSQKYKSTKAQKQGFSLVEVILAVALFALFATALIGLVFNSYKSDFQAYEKDQSVFYAQQGIEAVWSIKRQAWNLLNNGTYGVTNTSGYWQFLGSSDLLENKYTRTVTINDACRDISGNLVECPGSTVDKHAKKVTVKVSYTAINGLNNDTELTGYVTTWQTKNWLQTDWSGGLGQNYWIDSTKYFSDDGNIDYETSGEIKLKSLGSGGSCGFKTWTFDVSADYAYDSAKISVSGGLASLVDQGTGSLCSGTPNACNTFATQLTCQTQAGCSWLSAGCTNNVGGTCSNISPGNCEKNCGISGCIKQTGTGACIGTLDCSAFVVQADCTACTECLWNASSGCSGTASACNTFATQPTCQAQSGCIWSTNVAYPIDKPTINSVASYEATGIESWTSFSETATKNGGEIYYQLSDDDGATWKYYNGGWQTANSGDYNTASEINSNISQFPTSTGKIMFKSFLSSDGTQEVELDSVQISCAKFYNWHFDSPTDYTYAPAKISVSGGLASLVDLGTGGSCSGSASACNTFATQPLCQAQGGCSWTTGVSGATINPSFDPNSTDWTYNDWEVAGRVSGDWQSIGGNPNGYVRVVINGQKNNTISGYWQQPFVTSASNPNGTVSFDWRVPSYVATGLTSFYLYVFVENSSGAPTLANYVWRSPLITATTNWASVSNLDISSKLGVAGTYYLKLVVRGIYNNTNGPGTTIGAFDNVLLNWTGSSSCSGTPNACNTFSTQPTCQTQTGCSWSSSASYPTDKPTINPLVSYQATGLDVWSSFNETANKNGGEIYYQLSDNDGTSWQFTNGVVWIPATGPTDYNTASEINSNISALPTTTGKLMFRAFLSSNGSQQVQLDKITIGFGEALGQSGYATAGWLESSAFNTGSQSAFNFLSWTETIPSVSYDIQAQIATAPDNSGSPGTWTNWLGPSGASSFYTSGDEILIPLANNLNDSQWVKYKIFLSGDGVDTPVLQDIKVNYTP